MKLFPCIRCSRPCLHPSLGGHSSSGLFRHTGSTRGYPLRPLVSGNSLPGAPSRRASSKCLCHNSFHFSLFPWRQDATRSHLLVVELLYETLDGFLTQLDPGPSEFPAALGAHRLVGHRGVVVWS